MSDERGRQIEAVDALAPGFPVDDVPRICRVFDIVNAESALEALGLRTAEPLVVDDHQPVLRPHLVRMTTGRHADLGEKARIGGI